MAQTDYEIGRVLDRVKELDQEDNTLVILMIGDNGASAEGSLKGLANEVRAAGVGSEDQCPSVVGRQAGSLNQATVFTRIPKRRCASSTTCPRTSPRSTSTRSAPKPLTTTTPSVRFAFLPWVCQWISGCSDGPKTPPDLMFLSLFLIPPPTPGPCFTGWAHAMNTPFKWTKQIASHYGGVRNPMVISWPKRIKEDVHGQVSKHRGPHLTCVLSFSSTRRQHNHTPLHTHPITLHSSARSGTTSSTSPRPSSTRWT